MFDFKRVLKCLKLYKEFNLGKFCFEMVFSLKVESKCPEIVNQNQISPSIWVTWDILKKKKKKKHKHTHTHPHTHTHTLQKFKSVFISLSM